MHVVFQRYMGTHTQTAVCFVCAKCATFYCFHNYLCLTTQRETPQVLPQSILGVQTRVDIQQIMYLQVKHSHTNNAFNVWVIFMFEQIHM
jgi:hypothetical protein